jgi:hypothetical protein
MKKVSLLILLVGFVCFSASAQSNSETELVIIRVVEVYKGAAGNPVIHITENDGTYRVIELDKYEKNYLTEDNDGPRKVHSELKNYLSEGYRIVSHTKSAAAGLYEDYVLVKN